MNYKSLTKQYLDEYSKQEEITVVYRPHPRVNWGKNRIVYDGVMDLHYNHRSILRNEVVFDFDEGDIQQNSKEVTTKFINEEINYEKFSAKYSEKKGVRIHTFWNFKKCTNIPLMKRLILKHYAYGKGIDYQLCGKHLIRCEYGLYEKEYPKQNYNVLVESNEVGEDRTNPIPQEVWNKYIQLCVRQPLKDYGRTEGISINSEVLQGLLNGGIRVEDGRERILFFLIHQLKNIKTFEEVCEELTKWYHYVGGVKIPAWQIRKKVQYHWDKKYRFSKDYLSNILVDMEEQLKVK